jgi:hypothetical protein
MSFDVEILSVATANPKFRVRLRAPACCDYQFQLIGDQAFRLIWTGVTGAVG